MFIPKETEMTEHYAIVDFLTENAFAVMVSEDLSATHLPLTYVENEGEKGTFYGHIAKANPHWKQLDKQPVLLIFSGAHAYISPTWYAGSPNVPTWNYAAIHCYGVVRLLDEQETADSMSQLVEQFEPQLLNNAELMPQDYQQRLRKAVVGLAITVDDIQAKEKLGQHKLTADQQGVFQALKTSKRLDNKALAAYMQQRQLGTGIEK